MQECTLAEIVELANIRALGLYLSELQEHRSHCAERKRWTHAHRSGHLFAQPATSENEPHSPPGADTMKAIFATLEGLDRLCKSFDWKASETKIDMTYGHLKTCPSDDIDWSSLEADLRNAADMVIADLCRSKLVKVGSAYYEYINSEGLMDSDFKDKFPSAVFDVKEAGNCIAVDSGTAAVFHLMRAVEWAMRALCVDLGMLETRYKDKLVPIEYSQWEQILNQLPEAIENRVESFPRGAKAGRSRVLFGYSLRYQGIQGRFSQSRFAH